MKKVINLLTVIIIFATVFTSCEKLEVQNENNFGYFSKEIKITDEEENNQMVLKISSNEEDIINYFSEENFEIIPVLEGQSFSSANKEFFKNHPEYTTNIETKETDVENNGESYSVTVEIVEKNKNDNVKSLTIFCKPPDIPNKGGWNYMTYYSQKNIDHTFHIDRNSFWHRVFFGLQYKANHNSSWSTTISEWKKLSNNSSYSYTYSRCYQMKARVKFKKNNDFTVNFEE